MKKLLSLAFFLFYIGVFFSNAQDTITVNFAYTGAVQNWTVPCGVKQVKIKIAGGAGGNFSYPPNIYLGGNGASLTGICTVTSGENLSIVCGHRGGGILNYDAAAGGGGSFVYDSNTFNLLIVAAGGGGAGAFPTNSTAGGPGGTNVITNTTTNGGAGSEPGGTGGNGGNGGILNSGGGGGAGWTSNGGNVIGTYPCNGGSDKANSFAGGKGSTYSNAGGYGGGGGGGAHGGGGGGGYNGGGGGDTSNAVFSGGGGGGGSYLNGTLVGSPKANNTGNGYVSIIYVVNPLKKNSITVNQHVSCNGGNNGSASVTVKDGVLPYSYSWSDAGSQTTDTATGLSAGTYTVTVSDSCGAFVIDSVKITQPAGMVPTADSTNVTASCNGSAWVIVSGGTVPYNYMWNTGATTDTIGNQCGGNYCCVITDAYGCKDSACTTINITTGIENSNSVNTQLFLFPNPNNGVFNLTVKCVASVNIYNVLGQKVFTAKLNPGKTVVELSNNAGGIYLYRVLTETGDLISEGKFIIQK